MNTKQLSNQDSESHHLMTRDSRTKLFWSPVAVPALAGALHSPSLAKERLLSPRAGVAVTLVVRGEEVIMPRGSTALRPGDHVFIAMRKPLKPFIDRLSDPYAETPPLPPGLTLAFHRDHTVGQLHRFFGIPGPTWSPEPVGALLDRATEDRPARLGPFQVSQSKEPEYVTLTYAPDPEAARDDEAPGAAVRPAMPAPDSAAERSADKAGDPAA